MAQLKKLKYLRISDSISGEVTSNEVKLLGLCWDRNNIPRCPIMYHFFKVWKTNSGFHTMQQINLKSMFADILTFYHFYK